LRPFSLGSVFTRTRKVSKFLFGPVSIRSADFTAFLGIAGEGKGGGGGGGAPPMGGKGRQQGGQNLA